MRSRRVLLVSANRESFPEPVFPLGAAYVAGALRREGAAVRLFDAGGSPFPVRALRSEVASFRPDAVGLSLRNLDNAAWPCTRSYLPSHASLAAAIRRATRAPLLLGGPAFSLFPERLLAELHADGGVAGDGEEGVVRLLRGGEGPVVRAFLGDLSSVGLPPDLPDLFPRFRRYRTAGIQASRGCPHRCAYCTYPLLEGRTVRTRPPEEVAREAAFLHRRLGVRDLFVVDSVFNADEGHMARVCESIASLALPLRLSCYLSPKVSHPSLFRLLRRAGCVAADFGTDSGSDRVLRALGKGFTADDVARASEGCAAAGIDACHSLLLGAPGETAETVRETVRLMDRLRPRAVVAMTGVRIYPGTELERLAREEGVLSPGEDLLRPRFYLSEGSPGVLVRTAAETAAARGNWFLPGARDWSSAWGPRLLRLVHRGGPLWRTLRPTP